MRHDLLRAENVCLQIIDVQESLMAKIHQLETVTDTVTLMIRCARICNIPIIANTQYRKGLGPYVAEVAKLVGPKSQIDKVEFNGMSNGKTRAALDGLDQHISTIILVGVETHICIYQTAVGLLNKGFKVWVVADGVGARKKEEHDLGLQRMRNLGVSVGSAEMLIYEILGKAGSKEFKEILPLIIARDNT